MILDDWEAMLPKFRKVMPVEYRKALKEMERAQAVEQPSQAGE
jgi:glutamate synthase (NADPH/NADH) large chain